MRNDNLRWARTRRSVLALLVLAAVGLGAFAGREAEAQVGAQVGAQGGAAGTPVKSLQLVIDYGDGVTKTFANLTFVSGMTVLDLMVAAKAHSHGIVPAYTGQGASAFLTQIDDVANQGAGANARNWQFWVNDNYGDKSFGIFPVAATDMVTWRFATFRP